MNHTYTPPKRQQQHRRRRASLLIATTALPTSCSSVRLPAPRHSQSELSSFSPLQGTHKVSCPLSLLSKALTEWVVLFLSSPKALTEWVVLFLSSSLCVDLDVSQTRSMLICFLLKWAAWLHKHWLLFFTFPILVVWIDQMSYCLICWLCAHNV